MVGRVSLPPPRRPAGATDQHGAGPRVPRTAMATAAGTAVPTPVAAWLLSLSEHDPSPQFFGKR